VSTLVEVVHFADAACPWDYSAEPVRIALEADYGEQLSWRTVQVGLHESGEAMAGRGYTTRGLAESYRIFQERYGMPFCTDERPRLAGSWSGARTVKAAELQSPSFGAALLRRLRLAWFVEGRLPDDRDVLLALAGELEGVDVRRLAADRDGAEVEAAFERDMAEARRPDRVALALEKAARALGEDGDRFSTPTYVLSAGGRSVTVPGFQPLEAYEVALQNLVPELERRPAGEAADFLRERQGEPFATVEIAKATRRSERRTVEALEALVGSEPVQRTVAGARELWSWGPPAFTLACPALPRLPARLERELAA